MRRFGFWLFWLLGLPGYAGQTVVSFDGLFTGPEQNVHDTSFTTDAVTFVNTFIDWGGGITSWAGFAFSTVSNTTNSSWANQYAAAEAHSNAYAVGYHDSWNPPPEILFDLPCAPKSVRINNTAYTASAIRNGTSFNRAFTNGDFFALTLTARDLDGNIVAATNHYLADFRGTNFIQTNWCTLDLSWMPPTVVSLAGTLETTDVGAWGPNTPMYFALADFAYGYNGIHDGISATNPAILCWATGVADYSPGPNISNQFSQAEFALGPAVDSDLYSGTTNIVSLGDSGTISLTFPVPITDAPGPDFAVFENAISNTFSGSFFLEFAFVEVSSDGTNFFRFPCHTLATNPVDPLVMTGLMDTEAIGGLAGKHPQGFGTLFDLHELAGIQNLDVRSVTCVRLVDVVGNGSVADSYGHPLYDPYPTIGSGGFDLDAVGVLHPLIQIAAATNAPAPALPGFATVLEYTPALAPAAWTTNTPPQRTNGFYRWRLVR